MEEKPGFPPFFNRDLSWLYFNERILMEASRETVPLLERISFLSIFSSNLDEFYRVRMPVILALKKIGAKNSMDDSVANEQDLLAQVSQLVLTQQQKFGEILLSSIIPSLQKNNINLIHDNEIPAEILPQIKSYFLSSVLAFLQPVYLDQKTNFFPANNQLYFLITLKKEAVEKKIILNIPSTQLPRFFKVEADNQTFIVFIDDIIRRNLNLIFKDEEVTGCYSFKITRDAEIDLKDEYEGDLADQIEAQLLKRDKGLATRFLYQPGIPEVILTEIKKTLDLKSMSLVAGGRYHHLKDLSGFPVRDAHLSNQSWFRTNKTDSIDVPLAEAIQQQDIVIHVPYQSYDSVLRFFNEAAIDESVQEIYITLYRVASNSKIVNALISAAQNGKKVFVLVELKARFDEENNIQWAKKMKDASVKIMYSVTALKVHAKIALVKRKVGKRLHYTGLLATGNFNEVTAAFYTDHILMTANPDLLREMELLFIFLAKRVKPSASNTIQFAHLLVAQFNLQQRFLQLIDREINHVKNGHASFITIKLNNLEEQALIAKLYEASQAGVQITLVVRSICCLIPGVKGVSENIKVIRIVDRYLEHGRIFVFHNRGNQEVFLGSADWMNRNIYRRIEVCFPVYDEIIRKEILEILNFQINDNVQAVTLNGQLKNVPVAKTELLIQSQYEIYKYLNHNRHEIL
jgi:polyphosphate kinase